MTHNSVNESSFVATKLNTFSRRESPIYMPDVTSKIEDYQPGHYDFDVPMLLLELVDEQHEHLKHDLYTYIAIPRNQMSSDVLRMLRGHSKTWDYGANQLVDFSVFLKLMIDHVNGIVFPFLPYDVTLCTRYDSYDGYFMFVRFDMSKNMETIREQQITKVRNRNQKYLDNEKNGLIDDETMNC